jgi:hypothetical protein
MTYSKTKPLLAHINKTMTSMPAVLIVHSPQHIHVKSYTAHGCHYIAAVLVFAQNAVQLQDWHIHCCTLLTIVWSSQLSCAVCCTIKNFNIRRNHHNTHNANLAQLHMDNCSLLIATLVAQISSSQKWP